MMLSSSLLPETSQFYAFVSFNFNFANRYLVQLQTRPTNAGIDHWRAIYDLKKLRLIPARIADSIFDD